MDKSKIKVGVAVVLLVLAGYMFTRFATGPSDAAAAAGTYVKCAQCDYVMEIEPAQMMAMEMNPMVCPECKQGYLYPARACEECQAVYIPSRVENGACPECGHHLAGAGQE